VSAECPHVSGGSSPNPVYMIGRDSGPAPHHRGKDIRFVGTPFSDTNGWAVYPARWSLSGGLERNVIAAKSDAIGYLGRAISQLSPVPPLDQLRWRRYTRQMSRTGATDSGL